MMARKAQDPAVETEQSARLAEQAFLSRTGGSVGEECTREFAEAEARWQAADEAFAEAVPTTRKGVLLKLNALIDLARAAGASDDSLEMRHLRALGAYVAASPETAGASTPQLSSARM